MDDHSLPFEPTSAEGGDESEALVDYCSRYVAEMRKEISKQVPAASARHLARYGQQGELLLKFQVIYLGSSEANDLYSHLPECRADRQIGISSSIKLYTAIQEKAKQGSVSTSEAARRLFACGLQFFDSSREHKSVASLLKDFEPASVFFDSKPLAKRWMLRVDRSQFATASVLSNETSMALSQFSLMCIAYALYQTITNTSLCHTSANDLGNEGWFVQSSFSSEKSTAR